MEYSFANILSSLFTRNQISYNYATKRNAKTKTTTAN